MGAKMCSQMEKIIKNLKNRGPDLQNESLVLSNPLKSWIFLSKIKKISRLQEQEIAFAAWRAPCIEGVKPLKLMTVTHLQLFFREPISHKKSSKWEPKCAPRWRKSLKIFKTEREPISHKKSLKWEPKCAPRWRKSLKISKTEHSNNKTNFIEFCSQILQNREFFSLKAKAPRTGNRIRSITGSRYRGSVW